MNKCTTIEERAKAFCENNICVTCGDRKNCNRKCLGTCIPTYDALEWLIQFGKSEREELTRWRDPKEELPELLTPVLGRQSDCQNTYYKIVYRHEYDNEDGRYRWTDSEGCPIYVDGWQKIHA
ncbi:hypothetical protein [Alistipes finegoldii]|jgi:hypothetical protein|uniref:hypothetical protein n=1 Tax=Alistipes finegoldii TaxID=214856 RepID=UPI0028060673|nr:hypothetical protein [uncultured Alistipes sp.]